MCVCVYRLSVIIYVYLLQFVTPSNQFVPEIVNFLCYLFTTSLIEAKDSEGTQLIDAILCVLYIV